MCCWLGEWGRAQDPGRRECLKRAHPGGGGVPNPTEAGQDTNLGERQRQHKPLNRRPFCTYRAEDHGPEGEGGLLGTRNPLKSLT